MNTIIYAVNEIKHIIPYEVLHAAMSYNEDPNLYNMSSLEDKIINKVIKQRVLVSANVVGGIEYMIPIATVQPTFSERLYTVYRIPSELTLDKEIVSVLSLTYLPAVGFMGVQGGFGGPNMIYNPSSPVASMTSGVTNIGSRIAASQATSGILSNAHLELVARNTVAVYAHYQVLSSYGLRVILENDSNLNNIQPRSYHHFSTLCALATKAYIYKHLSIALNSGYLAGGQELGMFKTIVESYADAEEQYQIYLTQQWPAVALMNDTTRHHRHLVSMLAPDL